MKREGKINLLGAIMSGITRVNTGILCTSHPSLPYPTHRHPASAHPMA